MIKKIIFIIVCLGLGIRTQAKTTDISLYDNVIYPSQISGEAGTSVSLSVNMKNTIAMTGFQFDLVLPDGVSVAVDNDDFAMIELSETRTTSKKTDYFNSAPQIDGSFRVMASSTQNYTFSGNDGEVAVIHLNIDENVSNGEYPIILKNIVMSDATSKTYEVERVEGLLTVGAVAPQYDKGYKVWIEPFKMTEDVDDIEILLENIAEISNVEFDMYLQSTYISKDAYGISLGTSTSNTKKYSCSISDNENGTLHVACSCKGSNVIASDAGCILKLGLWYTDEDDAPLVNDGIYELNIRNIVLTDTEGNKLYAKPSWNYYKVGTAAKGDFSLSGDYTSIDLCDMTVDETTSLSLANPNAIIYIASGKSIKNNQNVVSGTTCNKLVLTDGYDFMTSKAFTAQNAQYSRSVPSSYGTIVLPFAPTNTNAKFYELTNSSDDCLQFEEVSTPVAGVPYLFTATSGVFSAQNVSVSLQDPVSKSSNDWTMTGTYANKVFTATDDVFEVSGGELHKNAGTINVGSFRAYITGTATSGHIKILNPSHLVITDLDNEEVDKLVETGDNIELTDGAYKNISINEDVEGVNVEYVRTFKNTLWQPWYMPFDVTLTEELLKDFKFAEFAGAFTYENGEMFITVVTVKEGGTIKANTPYMVKSLKTDGTTPVTMTVSNTTLHQTEELTCQMMQSSKLNFTFSGLYNTKQATSSDYGWYYYTNKNTYSMASNAGTAKVGPMRFFFTIEPRQDSPYQADVTPSEIKIQTIDDDVVGIDVINKKKLTGNAYNLNGQAVGNDFKGFVILNGKMIFKK